ncbi:anaerobic dimethyl sulfoxide reductase subunit C (anchor subunit) [Orbus hercynius]|uniref:Anaerobic dimethyl sulfoxide reductase subunit C (Anchor subunit) n=1 Tax=Orbus hercynius TaxID=593135 RepID=A0A495RJS8_9GAMM|nr:DmsC/YnfH family molybdoenzyme membrane anchor subunit [Orbus hercynius]RKS87581.1 anaerobic dimethyl sulfoxide reductase subunit C (anchor subunit) [Orbus hercynius]
MHELPLVFFTIFGQMGAGAVLIAGLCYLISQEPQRLIKIERINIAALIIMAIGMGIASLHLGHPLRALNVIFGIGRSPMSNEIFSFGVLFGITFVNVLHAYFTPPNRGNKFAWLKKIVLKLNQIPAITKLLAALQVIVSVFFVWMIVATYMLPTVKNWDTPYTAMQMYTSMLILGGALVIPFGLRRSGFIFFIVGIAAVLITKLSYIGFVSQITPDLALAQHSFWYLQCGLLALALLITFVALLKVNKASGIYILSLILALAGELCGRIAFYNLWAIPM